MNQIFLGGSSDLHRVTLNSFEKLKLHYSFIYFSRSERNNTRQDKSHTSYYLMFSLPHP